MSVDVNDCSWWNRLGFNDMQSDLDNFVAVYFLTILKERVGLCESLIFSILWLVDHLYKLTFFVA